ncbi:MAG: hypothetical protein IOC86_13015 [Aestuariivirga sp.]|nr:hypothetical protein [Aestuariivirga sp.]
MPIEFVGSATATATANAGTSIDLTALTGGIGSAAAAGDIVLLLRTATGTMSSLDLSVSGYERVTDLAPAVLFDDTVNHEVFWKLMPGTPDTSITLPLASSSVEQSAIAMVFRGVDPTTPFDATRVTASSTTTATPNPAQITTVTNNAVVVVMASSNSEDAVVTSPSGYSTAIVASIGDSQSYACYKAIPSAGAENPAAFTNVANPSGQDIYGCTTLALRPAAGAGGNIKVWNGSAWVARPVKVWNGTNWVTKPAKRWTGTAWVTTNY